MTDITIYSLDDLFKPINEWVDIILKLFSKFEIKGYRLTREFVIELLLFAYTHDKFKEIIVAPISFHINFKELYGAYMDQWEK
jgi:hypothetical protein